MGNPINNLEQYGIDGRWVRSFDAPVTQDALEYLDLLDRKEGEPGPSGVVENQGKPLLFFVDESRPGQSSRADDMKRLRRSLACRGDRAYLARIQPGKLHVVPVSLDEQMPEWQIYEAGTQRAQSFYSNLALGRYEGKGDPSAADQVFNEMFELLLQGANRLATKLDRPDVLSLIGRALFFRFLQDRHVISDQDARSIYPDGQRLGESFDNPDAAAHTCAWLDRTFNGHFLPLPNDGDRTFFERAGAETQKAVFQVLGAILRGDAPVGESDYQARFNWGDFEFAHIPVGLLSQVYEKFVWTWDKEDARQTSVHYTPRNIAAAIVDEAFHGLPRANEARVLDPACGAGVFLVLAFRRLYREHWRASGKRPDTRAIRSILERQLVGLDINDSALNMAALSLYLTAIELDPKPVPPEKLKFRDLRNLVLFNMKPHDHPKGRATLGSLRPDEDRFNRKFDLVLSNPPWTSLEEKDRSVADEFTILSRDIVRRRSQDPTAAYQNPDSGPDLPFVWKSTEWCKPEGRIALALPARILFKQGPVPTAARDTLFRLLEVAGIINGSNLSDTDVWPEMGQPFMLLFARNRVPDPSHAIRFITPLYDVALNKRGEMRVDSKSATPVTQEETVAATSVWKTLAVGTQLDLDLVGKYKACGRPVAEYWDSEVGPEKRGNGYQIAARQKQVDASHLHGLPDLSDPQQFAFVVDPELLPRFSLATACFPRKRSLYRAPLMLFKESPGPDRKKGWALLCFEDVAFDESFHGFSAADIAGGEALVRFLHLLVHSKLWMHYALMISPKFGAERRKIYKSDLDDFPIIPFESLPAERKARVRALSERLERGDQTVFVDIDAFFTGLYGLDDLDMQVIQDTLDVCLPYKTSRERACKPPTARERALFRSRIEALLSPFFKVIRKTVRVQVESLAESPFSSLVITVGGDKRPAENLGRMLERLAVETAATQIVHEFEGGLAVGIRNQYRYWTLSRARLLAADIVRAHISPFLER